MTKKEVLDWLYRIKSKLTMYFPSKWVSECEQAIDYAIKALENQKSMVEELEKIKAEMNVELFKEYSAEREFDSGYESCLKQQINRIDNHIKELKGENDA